MFLRLSFFSGLLTPRAGSIKWNTESMGIARKRELFLFLFSVVSRWISAFGCQLRSSPTNFKLGKRTTQSRPGTYPAGRKGSLRKVITVCLLPRKVLGGVALHSAAKPFSAPTTFPRPILCCSTPAPGPQYAQCRSSTSGASRTTFLQRTLPTLCRLRKVDSLDE